MIPALREEFPEVSVVQLCRILKVPRASAYRKARPEADPLRAAIERIVTTFLGYGYRRVTRELNRQGIRVGEHRVRRCMQENGLGKRLPRSRGITSKDRQAAKAANLLRQFQPTQTDEIWVTDMTLIRTRSGPCYLAVMEDLYSRKIVSWHLSRSPDLNLALHCLDKALKTRKPKLGWIHHSDQGSVYTAPGYQARVRAAGGRMSMSRTATPTDNAHVESFFRTLKKEEALGNAYASFLELETSLERYIQGNYNALRMHSSLGYLSPDQFETRTGEAGY